MQLVYYLQYMLIATLEGFLSVSSTTKTTIYCGSFWNTSCRPTPTQRLSEVPFYFGLQIPTARRPSAERTRRFLPLSTCGLLPRTGNIDSRDTPCFWLPVTINPSRAQFCVAPPSLLFRRVVRSGAALSAVAQAKRLPPFRACLRPGVHPSERQTRYACDAGGSARSRSAGRDRRRWGAWAWRRECDDCGRCGSETGPTYPARRRSRFRTLDQRQRRRERRGDGARQAGSASEYGAPMRRRQRGPAAAVADDDDPRPRADVSSPTACAVVRRAADRSAGGAGEWAPVPHPQPTSLICAGEWKWARAATAAAAAV
jgi:hypothetical protein